MRVLFKNMKRSEMAEEAVQDRLRDVVEKFPKVQGHRITVTLSMENSPHRAGPDAFTVRLLILGREYGTITLSKTATSLYLALADVKEHLLETLNRAGDRARVIRRARERRFREAV